MRLPCRNSRVEYC